MGVVTIIENKGAGLYKVNVKKDTKRAELLLSNLQVKISQINTKLAALVIDQSALINSNIVINQEVDSLINQQASEQLINSNLDKILQNNLNLEKLTLTITKFRADIFTKSRQVNEINKALNQSDNRDIWACDFADSLNIGSDYASIEIDQDKKLILIAPHTYIIKEENINELSLLISNEDSDILNSNSKITKFNSEILSAQAEINNKKILIAGSQGDNSKLQNELNALNQRVQKLNLSISFENKKIIRANKIKIRLVSLRTDFDAALISASGIYTPKIDKYTKLLQQTISSSAEAVYYNLALLPGLQKFAPTFRTGQILSIEYKFDRCSVKLDPTKSSQQSLIINQQSILNLVPIEYGSCDSAVFNVNDRVIVGFFGDFNTPKVIGFLTNPRDCFTNLLFSQTIADQVSTVRLMNLTDSGIKLDKNAVNSASANINWISKDKRQVLAWNGPYNGVQNPLDNLQAETGSAYESVPYDTYGAYSKFGMRYTAPFSPGTGTITAEVTSRWSNSLTGRINLTIPNVNGVVLGAAINSKTGEILAVINPSLPPNPGFIQDALDYDYFQVLKNGVWSNVIQIDHNLSGHATLYRATPVFFDSSGERFIIAVDYAIDTDFSGFGFYELQREYKIFSVNAASDGSYTITQDSSEFTNFNRDVTTTHNGSVITTTDPGYDYIYAKGWKLNSGENAKDSLSELRVIAGNYVVSSSSTSNDVPGPGQNNINNKNISGSYSLSIDGNKFSEVNSLLVGHSDVIAIGGANGFIFSGSSDTSSNFFTFEFHLVDLRYGVAIHSIANNSEVLNSSWINNIRTSTRNQTINYSYRIFHQGAIKQFYNETFNHTDALQRFSVGGSRSLFDADVNSRRLTIDTATHDKLMKPHGLVTAQINKTLDLLIQLYNRIPLSALPNEIYTHTFSDMYVYKSNGILYGNQQEKFYDFNGFLGEMLISGDYTFDQISEFGVGVITLNA